MSTVVSMPPRVLALSVFVACLANTAAAQPRVPEADSEEGRRAVIVGSSSIHQAFGRVLERALVQRGYHVTRKGVTSAGFARPDFRDMNAITDALSISRKTAIVLVYLGLNDAQALRLSRQERQRVGQSWIPWSDPRWSRVYERRIVRYLERICSRGARRAVMLLPVDVAHPRLQRRLHRIRRLQARATAASSCGMAIDTAGDWNSFRAAGVARRRADGFHMTNHGARVIWKRIRAQTLSALQSGRPRSAARSAPANQQSREK